MAISPRLTTYYITNYMAHLGARRPLSEVIEERNQLRLRDAYMYKGTQCVHAWEMHVYAVDHPGSRACI